MAGINSVVFVSRSCIQQDLDRNHERVRGIMTGMDSVVLYLGPVYSRTWI